MSVRVLIVGEDAGAEDGLRSSLASAGGIEIVGDARSGEEALRLARQLRPDAVLLSLAGSGAGAASSLALAGGVAAIGRQELRRAEQFRLIAEIGRRVTAILTVDELLSQAPALIQQTFGFYHVHIAMVEGDMLTFKADHGVWQRERDCQICAPERPRIGAPGEGLCAWVAYAGRPAVVANVEEDARYLIWHAGQKGSALVLPVQVKGEVLGVLEVESDLVAAFDETDVLVLQSLADQLAVAIVNARLHEQTQQLAAAAERQKLARELHDSISQALYGIVLGTHTARSQLERDPSKVAEPLDYVISLARAAQAEMRALIFELRPESLEKEGLAVALARHAEALAARHRIAVSADFCPEPALPLAIKETLYRIGQEALHNVVKHARATRVDLCLGYDGQAVRLSVRDDGKGFDPQGHFPGHMGLQSMRERAAQHGGDVLIESAPGRGTLLLVEIPVAGGELVALDPRAVHSRRS